MTMSQKVHIFSAHVRMLRKASLVLLKTILGSICLTSIFIHFRDIKENRAVCNYSPVHL